MEINADAVAAIGQHFPDVKSDATILIKAVRRAMPKLAGCQFELTLTMAVLLHIHSDSEWIFNEIVRVAKEHLVNIEDQSNYKILPPQYQSIFESRGIVQIHGVPTRMQPTYTTRIGRPR